MRDPSEIASRVAGAFPSPPGRPPLSLRGGAALDLYDSPPPFDPALDRPSEAYLERFDGGIAHLDPASWLYYLPLCLEAMLRRAGDPGNPLVEAVLWSLRPPDRDPPRFGLLSAEQEAAIAEAIEFVAFSPDSRNQEFALQVLEEYWIPGASYR